MSIPTARAKRCSDAPSAISRVATNLVIATKVNSPMRPGPNGRGLSRKAILFEVEQSLQRLGTDYIDLYIIHRFDYDTPLEETLEALNDVVRAGKVRYLGASSMHAWQLMKALGIQRANGWAKFVSMQNYYNLLYREEEREMLRLCLSEGRGRDPVVAAGPWPAGPPLVGRSRQPSAPEPIDFAKKLFAKTVDIDKPVIDRVNEVARERGLPPSQIALAWLLHKPVDHVADHRRDQATSSRRRLAVALGQAFGRGNRPPRRVIPATSRHRSLRLVLALSHQHG